MSNECDFSPTLSKMSLLDTLVVSRLFLIMIWIIEVVAKVG